MLDIKFIRSNPDAVRTAIQEKGVGLSLDELLQADGESRKLQTELEELQRERNAMADGIKSAPADKRPELIAKGREIGEAIARVKPAAQTAADRLRDMLLLVPQIPAPDAPRGKSDKDNVEVRRVGRIREFDFKPRDHVELLKMNGWAELDRIARVAGTRSYALKGTGALLEHAVLRLAIDKLVAKGFKLVNVPSFAIEEAFVGSGQFPTGRGEAYYLDDAKKFLAGTSEVSLNYLHAGEMLQESELPILYAGYSACFRKEAGSAGRDVRGLIRVHQFYKVEQYVICKSDPEESRRWHDVLLQTSEEILQALELPYRVVACCTGDMGPGKVRMNDVETWVPSEQLYRETHSCSTLHEWQARRTGLRYRDGAGEPTFCHTLNNTAAATPRLLVPLLENHQQADGSVLLPAALRPYMGGQDVLR